MSPQIKTSSTADQTNMILSQLKPNEITDPLLLAAIAAVDRRCFVPEAYKHIAYQDKDIPLTDTRYMMAPMPLARLIQSANIGPSDRVLVVGSLTGYTLALIHHLSPHVVGLESDESLADQARQNLKNLNIEDLHIAIGPLKAGYPRQAPYDVIIIEGAVQHLPPTLIEQMATEGTHPAGRVVAILRAPQGASTQAKVAQSLLGQGILWQKSNQTVTQRFLFDASAHLLEAFQLPQGFQFN